MPIGGLLNPAITVTRASVAPKETAAGLVSVAANLARLETVASGPILARTLHGNYQPLGLDVLGNRLLIGEQGTALNLRALSAADAVSDILVAHTAVEEDVGDSANITSVKVHGSTWYLFVRNRVEPYDGAKWLGKVFKTTDGGATVTRIHRNHQGGAPNSASPAISDDGQRLCYGTYGTYSTGVSHAVYLSEDGGTAWDAIYDPGTRLFHVHTVRFDPDPDVIWVFCGDNPHSCLVKLARPEGWEPGDGAWTATVVYDGEKDLVFSSEHGEVFGGKVFIHGNEGLSYDPATGLVGRFLDLAVKDETGTNSRYAYWATGSAIKVQNMLAHGGVLYASGYTYYNGASNGDEGIYASVDGLHWTCLLRPAAGLGFRDLTCVWRDRIWCVERTGANSVMASFPVASLAQVQALRLEAGATNVITGRPDSTFDTVGGGAPTINRTGDATCCHWSTKWWSVTSHNSVALSIVAGGADDSGHCLQVDASIDQAAEAAVALLPHQAGWHTYDATATGVRVFIRARVKAVAPWPQNYAVQVYPFDTIGTIASDGNQVPVTPSESDWIDICYEGTVTALASGVANLDDLALLITCDSREGTLHTASVLVDCVEIRFGAGWPSGDSYVDPLYSPRANESATVSLAGYGLPSSLLFSWRPESGWAEYAADVPLVTVHGAGSTTVAVKWCVADQKFAIWNGTDIAALSTAIKWRHFDELKFALSFAANGVPTLRLYEPAGGVQAIAGAAVGVPIDAHFGVDPAETGFGAGLFHSLAGRRSVVSAADFLVVAGEPGWNQYGRVPYWLLGLR